MRRSAICTKKIVHGAFPITIFDVGRSDDFAQALHEGLGLTICLRPEGRDLLMVEAKSLRERLERLAVKWRSIIGAHRIWDTMDRKHVFHRRDDSGRIGGLVP